jgi:choline dehydrogenase-like flavoprotein
MPDEEIAEEGIISPTAPAIQDPLLRELLAENEAKPAADIPQEKPLPLPAQSETVDCIVIGLGAGGAPLLARLAQAGLKVVALEAGPWHNPEKDFATDEKAQDFLFWNDERLAAGADPLAMGKNNSGTGVGGSTLHYTAYTPRPLPDDLHIKRDFGQGEDWPLTYDDLAPYYEEVEQFIGVSGPTPYPWGPSRPKGYPLAALPLNSAAQLMVRGAEKLGIKTSPAANAALSGRYYQEGIGWREACTNRGFCQAGCSNGAKSSMDVTFIPLAVKYGADIRPNSYVTEIERNAKGEVAAVVYTQNGQSHRLACRNLFLCAGSVETPRLLLLNELALTSGQVGRNLMAHPGVQVWGTFADEVRPTKGIPGGLISQDTHRPKDADFIGGYLLQSIGVMPVTFSGQVARQRKMWGQPLRDYMRQFNHIAGINILGDCLPHADNYLELSDEKDGRQVAKPRLHFTAQENELRMNAHAEKLMRDIWAAAGATDIWSFPRYAHVIGTARMGLSGDDAVVDRNGRAFDVPNLYICDNSVFPSALSVNPALTIMALSLRTADKFLEQERRRDK